MSGIYHACRFDATAKCGLSDCWFTTPCTYRLDRNGIRRLSAYDAKKKNKRSLPLPERSQRQRAAVSSSSLCKVAVSPRNDLFLLLRSFLRAVFK